MTPDAADGSTPAPLNEVRIKSKGIKKTLNGYTPERALAEYIWNGFDAGASCVSFECERRDVGGLLQTIDSLAIRDNGEGIPFEGLAERFAPFLESHKALKKNQKIRDSKTQGDEGKGRLTFFKFCQTAEWSTVYERDGKRFQYSITIHADTLEHYPNTPPTETQLPKGTSVKFTGLNSDITPEYLQNDVKEFLKTEFCWFLELNRARNCVIEFDSECLDWQTQIVDRAEFKVHHSESNNDFSVRFVRWRQSLSEFSRFYYLTGDDKERFKQATSFNNKGDGFYHSLYISSPYFETFGPSDTQDDGQQLLGTNKEPFFYLKKELTDFLRSKRKALLRQFSDKLIEGYEKEGVFPRFKTNNYDAERKKDLVELIKTLYEAEPRVFVSLNLEQKKTFIGLLNVLLDSDERERVLQIIEEVIQLDADEQQELVALLRTTRLRRIIRTIKLIEDRYKTVELLKQLVFNPNLNANEVNDLQTAIEAHYWLFGEEFHLVTAAEPSFEEALRRLLFVDNGEVEDVELEHPRKRKQMDIFAVRQIVGASNMDCIVVELKHPKNVILGEEELSQVKGYLDILQSDQRFNGQNRTWKFILVGNKFNDQIRRELKNNRGHGEPSLVYNVDNCKIYVRTWDEIFTEFECRHNFVNKQLELQRDQLKVEARTKAHVLHELANNSAQSAPEIVVAKK
jgi:hypothetical protein